MATAAQVEAFRRSQDEVRRLVNRDMRRLWTGLRGVDPAGVRDALLEIGPSLSDQYGAVSAAMAAEWFESVSGHNAAVGALVAREAVESSIRYGIGPAFQGRSEMAFSRISSSLTRHSLQRGRNTIARSSRRSNMRYARAPEPGACAWCLMLSSRGAVYHSEETAGGANSWHEDCNCVPEPAPYRGDVSYDAAALYDKYKAAWEHYDNDRMVAARMRSMYGLT